eukprot:3207618-Prymnesium_polylepis.1
MPCERTSSRPLLASRLPSPATAVGVPAESTAALPSTPGLADAAPSATSVTACDGIGGGVATPLGATDGLALRLLHLPATEPPATAPHADGRGSAEEDAVGTVGRCGTVASSCGGALGERLASSKPSKLTSKAPGGAITAALANADESPPS